MDVCARGNIPGQALLESRSTLLWPEQQELASAGAIYLCIGKADQREGCVVFPLGLSEGQENLCTTVDPLTRTLPIIRFEEAREWAFSSEMKPACLMCSTVEAESDGQSVDQPWEGLWCGVNPKCKTSDNGNQRLLHMCDTHALNFASSFTANVADETLYMDSGRVLDSIKGYKTTHRFNKKGDVNTKFILPRPVYTKQAVGSFLVEGKDDSGLADAISYVNSYLDSMVRAQDKTYQELEEYTGVLGEVLFLIHEQIGVGLSFPVNSQGGVSTVALDAKKCKIVAFDAGEEPQRASSAV